jgi:hypothetical protein
MRRHDERLPEVSYENLGLVVGSSGPRIVWFPFFLLLKETPTLQAESSWRVKIKK